MATSTPQTPQTGHFGVSGYNVAEPLVMHIDLNSCFATCEQQARPLLRGKPVAISNRTGKNSAIITASYEAKALGVKVGMRRLEALGICPNLVFVESEPSKYRYVYHRLLDIMSDYSPHVTMKSIDEGVIDFSQSPPLGGRTLADVGMEIKQRLRDEVGCWMRCNVGISTNRFLAKTAAGLHKPDGMDIITADNLRAVLGSLGLRDLTGIAHANATRLNSVGIFTPLEFLDASEETLRKLVFRSVCGAQWHARLRGWEVDDRDSDIKTVGRQYVLESNRLTRQQILQRLFHLSEEVGAKLRAKQRQARGVYVYAKTHGSGFWHRCHLAQLPFATDQTIWHIARELFAGAPSDIREIGVTCYKVCVPADEQLSLFGEELLRERKITSAKDDINLRFGPRTIHSAETLQTSQVKAKIPFGSTRYL
jgi:DNA polymerase-4